MDIFLFFLVLIIIIPNLVQALYERIFLHIIGTINSTIEARSPAECQLGIILILADALAYYLGSTLFSSSFLPLL